jgi:hypothetical protein
MKARVDLLDHLYPRDTGDSTVWLAVSGCIEADDESFSPLITQQIIHARERAEKYCCAQMQGAVDGDDGTKFSFEMFRNEDPCWCINDDYAFARFCPWCGKELPDGSFE